MPRNRKQELSATTPAVKELVGLAYQRLSIPEIQELIEVLQALQQATELEQLEQQERSRRKQAALQGEKGVGSFEDKMIPDSKTGKSYGPYTYLRYWSGKVHKSIYLGKKKGIVER